MSGGAFDYQQYHIDDIANSIEEVIENHKKPEPPTKVVHYVSCKKQIDEGCYRYETIYADTAIGAKRELLNCRSIIEKDGKIIDKFDSWVDKEGIEHPCEYIISEGEYDEYEEGHDDCYYGERYSEEILEEFKKAVKILRKASIYAQRIDWLLSGDDGPESFVERLNKELKNLKMKTTDYPEKIYCNYIYEAFVGTYLDASEEPIKSNENVEYIRADIYRMKCKAAYTRSDLVGKSTSLPKWHKYPDEKPKIKNSLDTEFMVSIKSLKGSYTTSAFYSEEDDEFFKEGNILYGVYAWQELPEPYKIY